ncbi:MAG TPA: hypothetical protein VFZ41_01015 [Solirubrobacterales bacterium]
MLVPACLIVGYVAWQNFPSDETTRATVGEAVERFRQGRAAGEGPGGAALGVYSYRSRGSESADTGLLSAIHDYDGTSTVTIDRGPCGVLERWQVLAERWTEAEFCVPPKGSGLREISEFHEFFGRERKNGYRCRGRAPSRRKLRTPGTRWASTCSSKSGVARSRSQVVGIEKLTVAGKRFDAVHTTSDVVLEGQVSGTTTREDWRRRLDGLLLRRVVETEATMEGTPDADYEEQYTIELISTEPRR